VYASMIVAHASTKVILIILLSRLAVRAVRIIIKFFQGKKHLNQAARTTVTENKMRYNMDGWDLDLTYITTDVIVMSLPAMDYQALYRNRIYLFGVWCLVFGVWCLVFGVWCCCCRRCLVASIKFDLIAGYILMM
jgi:hypothetical protein